VNRTQGTIVSLSERAAVGPVRQQSLRRPALPEKKFPSTQISETGREMPNYYIEFEDSKEVVIYAADADTAKRKAVGRRKQKGDTGRKLRVRKVR
jgi:hypothetical protein